MSRPKKAEANKIDPKDNLFKRIRLFSKLSQDRLASYVGVAGSTVRRWEKRGNAVEPSFTCKQFKRLCEVANYSTIDQIPDTLINDEFSS